jgi:chemotaxis protein MotA
MLTIVGIIVVVFCVIGGYVLHGGHIMVLYQPTEYLIIVGAAVGALLMSAPMSLVKVVITRLLGTIKAGYLSKDLFMECLLLVYEITKTAKGNLLAIEAHVENPEGSDIFQRYPRILKNHHAIHFICDTLKVQVSSPMSPYDLEDLMDLDIETAHAEEHKAGEAVNRISDAMPGIGIVAAVLGVIITMGRVTESTEVIGNSVAGALVGTFLGIILCYGFLQPLAVRINDAVADEGKVIEVFKTGILAFAKDSSPKVCVEFARRAIPPEFRPTFQEVDEATANIKK